MFEQAACFVKIKDLHHDSRLAAYVDLDSLLTKPFVILDKHKEYGRRFAGRAKIVKANVKLRDAAHDGFRIAVAQRRYGDHLNVGRVIYAIWFTWIANFNDGSFDVLFVYF